MTLTSHPIGRMTAGLGAFTQSTVEEQLSARARSYMRTAGWPSEIARNARVGSDGERLRVHVPEAHQAKADDLEYGTEDRPPMGTIRQFEARIPNWSDAMAGSVVHSLARELLG